MKSKVTLIIHTSTLKKVGKGCEVLCRAKSCDSDARSSTSASSRTTFTCMHSLGLPSPPCPSTTAALSLHLTFFPLAFFEEAPNCVLLRGEMTDCWPTEWILHFWSDKCYNFLHLCSRFGPNTVFFSRAIAADRLHRWSLCEVWEGLQPGKQIQLGLVEKCQNDLQ